MCTTRWLKVTAGHCCSTVCVMLTKEHLDHRQIQTHATWADCSGVRDGCKVWTRFPSLADAGKTPLALKPWWTSRTLLIKCYLKPETVKSQAQDRDWAMQSQARPAMAMGICARKMERYRVSCFKRNKNFKDFFTSIENHATAAQPNAIINRSKHCSAGKAPIVINGSFS